MTSRSELLCLLCLVFGNLEGGICKQDEYIQAFQGHIIQNKANRLQSPFIDLRPDEISTYNRPYLTTPLRSLPRERRYISEFGNLSPEQEQPAPTDRIQSTPDVTSAMWEMKRSIETLYQRQDLIFNFVKCNNRYNYHCKQIEHELSQLVPLDWSHFASSGQNKSDSVHEKEQMSRVLDAFQTAIDDQRTRQELLYKYVTCVSENDSCSVSSLKEAFKDVITAPPQRPNENTQNRFSSNNPFFNNPGNSFAGQFGRPFLQRPEYSENYGHPMEANVETTNKEDKGVVSSLLSHVWSERSEETRHE